MESTSTTTATVEQVTKASSDELLSKFADKRESSLSKRQKRNQTAPEADQIPLNNSSGATRRSSALIRQLRVGRAHFRSRNFKNKSFLRTIEKTWRKTIEGASKVFMEKHYNRHKRLISDVA